MSRLSERFGLSGNGLAKICRRLDVPYPPRGYWATHLLQALQRFPEDFGLYETRLELHRERAVSAGTGLAGTVDLVVCELEACRLGIDHVIGLLDHPDAAFGIARTFYLNVPCL